MSRFHVLDDRQYRDYEVNPKPGRGGSNMIKDCAERRDSKRTLLGWKQEDWLKHSLTKSSATWDIVVQQTLMSQAKADGDLFWTDAWDGYPAARQRLLTAVDRGPGRDTIVVGGDVHAYAVCDLKTDFDDPTSRTVATEFCGASITSEGPSKEKTDALQRNNPHIHYANGQAHGYVRVSLNKDQAHVSLRSIENEKVPDSKITDLMQYVVEKGHPGVQLA